MRCVISILLFLSIQAFPQTNAWTELKQSIKKESDINKTRVLDIRQKKKLPISFSDGRNHFLLQAVHPSGKPIYLSTLNAGAATSSGAALLQTGATGFLLSATGQHIFQWDAGLVKPHIEFGNRIVANEGAAEDNHATHVAGILMAAGVHPAAKGMASNANLHSYYFDDDLVEIAAQAERNQYGFLISNHSYGITTGWTRVNGNWQWMGDETVSSDEDFTAGFYSLRTKQIDEIAFLAPYHTIVWAAGNDRVETGDGSHPPDCNGGTGYDCIIQEGVAKNIITVGAVNKVLNYATPTSVGMSTFSSWGPTDDGRIKPDLVGAGVSLFSTSSAGDDGYTTLSGTSMATPNVAGSLMLLQELFGKLNAGRWMKSATLKALAIHTAKEAGAAPGPDYSFGWGLIDVAEGARLLGQRDDENIFILERELINNDEQEWMLLPQANKKITATLVWTDPSGVSPGALLDPPHAMLINDLDIRLIANNGSQKFPWILDPGSPASPANRGDNHRDNVEKIEFDFPESAPYRLVVSHKGYLVNGAQPYSLIVSYTSSNTSKNFFWIGGPGNWSDPGHWSFTSGGSTSGMLPDQTDKVIVDENSFSGSGNIVLTSDAKCQSLRWWLTKAAGIDFNGHRLEVKKELTFASDSFQKIGDGKFVLSSLDSGEVNGHAALLQRPDLEFLSGQWQVRGNLSVDSLIISGGSLELIDAGLRVNHFLGQSGNAKFNSNNSNIYLSGSWQSDATKLEVTSMNSAIVIESDTLDFQSTNLNWTGILSISNSKVSMHGALALDSIFFGPASTLLMVTGSSLTVRNGFDALGEAGMPIWLKGESSTSLRFNFHKKLCLDFLHIAQLSLLGDAVVNLGLNSTLQNSTGWLQQDCNQIAFPDFDVRFNCENALTEFVNHSTGPIESYAWDFGDAAFGQNQSDKSNPSHQFNGIAPFTVSLTVTGAGNSSVYSKLVSMLPNPLAETHIEYNSEIMFSTVEATQYQWFENDLALPDEANRIFSYQGNEGIYQVVIYDGQCNRPSSPLLISAIDENPTTGFSLYPNPVLEKVFFNLKDVDAVLLVDCLGRYFTIPWSRTESWADVSGLEGGLYLLVLEKSGKKITKRLAVGR